jgi:hypothetical protein
MSALLELPRSAVCAVIVKWKCLGAITAQSRSGRPHKLTERDCNTHYRVPNCLWKEHQHNNCLSGASLNGFPWPRSRTSLRSPYTMPSVGWSGVKLVAIGLWSSGNVLWCDGSRFTIWQSNRQIWFGSCQENDTCPSANCKVLWRRNNGLRLFFHGSG